MDAVTKAAGDRLAELMDALATSLEPKLGAAIVDAITQLRERVPLAELEAIVATGDVDRVLVYLDLEALRDELRAGVSEGAAQAAAAGVRAAGLPASLVIRYDPLAPFAVSQMRAHEFTTLDYVRQDVMAGVRQVLADGIRAGQNPRATARQLRALVGLPPRLAQAAQNYRAALEALDQSALERQLRDRRYDERVSRAIVTGEPLTREQIDRQVAAYERRALRYAAETIARTEAMDVVHLGHRALWQQAVDAGTLDAARLRRWWKVARDERTCDRCRPIPALNPDGRGWDEPFTTPHDGLVMRPALHPRCRCVVFTRYMDALLA